MAKQTLTPASDEIIEQVKTGTTTFAKLTPGTLAGVDVEVLTPEQLKDYALAAKARLDDLTAAVYVDKRTGVLYVGTKQCGNVNRPLFKSKGKNPTSMIPSVLKTKDEHFDGVDIAIPRADVLAGMETLEFNLQTLCRIHMARIDGNGVKLQGQKENTDADVALVLGVSKSGAL